MPRRKRKGIELDSTSLRQNKQFSAHEHGEGKRFKGKDKKELRGGGQGSAHLSNKLTAAHNVDGYSGNWRTLAKVSSLLSCNSEVIHMNMGDVGNMHLGHAPITCMCKGWSLIWRLVEVFATTIKFLIGKMYA